MNTTDRQGAEASLEEGGASRLPAELVGLVQAGGVLALSGAGISTESGIPDYRGPASRSRNSRPLLYQQFVGSEEARRRYWARSLAGWGAIRRARPNRGHLALARLEAAGTVKGVITQNVDGLHQAAGSRQVLELHGSLAAVRCLGCAGRLPRPEMQRLLRAANPEFVAGSAEIAPDGDAELPADLLRGFAVPACPECGGVLKPDVVFFGENVPKARVEQGWAMLAACSALLVLGTSLSVRSGYRLVARAAELGKPVAIVNDGPTRGDGDAAVRVSARLGSTLSALAEALAPAAPTP